jgi:hypothetical protein
MNRRTAALALLAVLPALAGCLGDHGLFTPQGEKVHRVTGAQTWPASVAYDGNGTPVPLPAAYLGASFPRAVQQMVGKAGAEPNIGITSDDRLFVNTFDQTQRSDDHGREGTWTTVYNYRTVGGNATQDLWSTADPMLWVDPVTDRVFADHMHGFLTVGFCTYLAYSDDKGATWTENPLACGVPHIDHQKLLSAPWGPATQGLPVLGSGSAAPNPVYPNVLYLCTNDQDLGTWCTESYDGGLSWVAQQKVAEPDPTCGSINGHEAAFPDGTVALPLSAALTNADGSGCQRPLLVYVTEDNGLTWEGRACADGYGEVDVDPDITVTPDGTAYMVFRHNDQHTYLLRTKDKFRTCDVFRISPPDVKLSVFQAITSGDDGRIAMTWLGTRSDQVYGATPSNATGGSEWHAFVTTSLDAESADPTFVTQQATPNEDPVQVGCVWLGGGGGGPHRCRNLLDFIDMTSGKDGRFYAVLSDGCTPRNGCTGDIDTSEYQSRDAQVAVLVQDGGIGLKGDAPLPPLGLVAPTPYPAVKP